MSDFDVRATLFAFDQLSDTYLREEVENALTHQKELTPHLITVIESVANNPLLYSLEQRNAHTYAASLLSHFAEPDAHLPFIRAFSIPEEQLIDIWGDMTTETLPTMLYRTSGDSMEAIKELVANQEADQYVRCAAMEALSYFVAFQPSRRDEVIHFFHGLFTGDEAARDSYYWANMAATLCDLHPGDSMDVLRQAYEAGIIHKGFISWENIEEANQKTREEALTSLQTWVTSRMPVDVHAYISWFAEFHQDELENPFSFTGKPKPAKKKSSRKPKAAKKSGKRR
ncbi:MAG: DUF1186 domain-containing protein [Desulfobulbus sp.]|nr:DUF1186 domain-containing protein [Desulfobulbus sp.]